MKDFGIEYKQLVGVTTDTAGNEVAFGEAMVATAAEHKTTMFHQQCVPHRLNLCSKDALEEIDWIDEYLGTTFKQRCGKTVAHFHRSNLDAKALKDAQVELKLRPTKLIGYSPKRFGSSIRCWNVWIKIVKQFVRYGSQVHY
jgi:hypothetical protein